MQNPVFPPDDNCSVSMMYSSDSDDDSQNSQLSQPHLAIKKKSTDLTETKGEDVVDRARSSSDLINLSANVSSANLIDLDDGNMSVKSKTTPKVVPPKPSKSPTDKLLIKYSSSDSTDESISSEDTSLGEVLEGDELYGEDQTKLVNKSQQTSPTLFGSLNRLTFPKILEREFDWNELNKFGSIQSLESTVHSPELVQFQSKYLKNWHQQQRQYHEQKQSIESLDTRFGSKLDLNYAGPSKPEQAIEPFGFRRKQYGIFNFEFDEELFYKVKKLFPQVSDEKIRTFMYKHHNQEHDVIAATINSLSPKREKRRLKHQSAMDKVLGNYIRMHREIDKLDEERKRLTAKDEQDDRHNYAKVEIKIKYLKKLYPKVDELDLFYMLHNSDMKANNVAKKLEELGYERSSLSESEESLAGSLHFEEVMPDLRLNFDEQQARLSLLQKDYPLIDIYLVKQALKCTKFNQNEARKLLDTVDVNEYKNMKPFELDYSIDDSKFIYKTDRGTMTSFIDSHVVGNFYRVEREFSSNAVMVSTSTWTGEDGMRERTTKKSVALGPDSSNCQGAIKRER